MQQATCLKWKGKINFLLRSPDPRWPDSPTLANAPDPRTPGARPPALGISAAAGSASGEKKSRKTGDPETPLGNHPKPKQTNRSGYDSCFWVSTPLLVVFELETNRKAAILGAPKKKRPCGPVWCLSLPFLGEHVQIYAYLTHAHIMRVYANRQW